MAMSSFRRYLDLRQKAGIAAALAVLCATTAPETANAQTPCPPPPGAEMDRCLAGAWIGSNTAMEKLRTAFTGMGFDSVTDMTADMSHTLGIQIYEDGYFATIPFNRNVELQDFDEDTGEIAITQLDLRVGTGTGQIWTADGRLKFCDAGGGGAMLGTTTSTSSGTTSTMTPIPNGGSFVPDITYSCSADSFTMTVALPEPIGNVDYFLRRVDASRFPEELEELLRRED